MMSFAEAKENYGMRPVSVENATDKYQIDMPPTRTQVMGICYAESASLLLDRQTCVDKKLTECNQLRDDLRISSLDLTRFSKPAQSVDEKFFREAYVGIYESGSLSVTLDNAISAGFFATETCAPSSQLLPHAKDPIKKQKDSEALWKALHALHERYYGRLDNCGSCRTDALAEFSRLRDDFDFTATDERVILALSQKTLPEMLDILLIGDQCRDERLISVKPQYRVKTFPDRETLPSELNYNAAINVVKTVLRDFAAPLGVTFCARPGKLSYSSLEQCTSGKGSAGVFSGGYGHTVVIKGYARICKGGGSCEDALQIQNSWGEEWQKANKDGWVQARELLDRTYYEGAALVWLQDGRQ